MRNASSLSGGCSRYPVWKTLNGIKLKRVNLGCRNSCQKLQIQLYSVACYQNIDNFCCLMFLLSQLILKLFNLMHVLLSLWCSWVFQFIPAKLSDSSVRNKGSDKNWKIQAVNPSVRQISLPHMEQQSKLDALEQEKRHIHTTTWFCSIHFFNLPEVTQENSFAEKTTNSLCSAFHSHRLVQVTIKRKENARQRKN